MFYHTFNTKGIVVEPELPRVLPNDSLQETQAKTDDGRMGAVRVDFAKSVQKTFGNSFLSILRRLAR